MFYTYTVAVKADIGTTYNGHINIKENRFFEFSFSVEGITIEIKVQKGKLVMYGAYKNPNPNEINYDHVIRRIRPGKMGRPFIPQLANKAGRIFYCNLVGEKESKFSIKAEKGKRLNIN